MPKDRSIEGLSRNELLSRAENLQQENDKLIRENADLLRQIDAYFNNEGYDPFDMSVVLRERALSAESQLQQYQQQYAQVLAEREGLEEDLASTKEAKRQSDKAYREAMASNVRMEKDVEFYRKQFVDAMQARDRANGEVDRLKVENENVATLRSKCQAELKAERTAHAEARRRVQLCEAELAILQRPTDSQSHESPSEALSAQEQLPAHHTSLLLEQLAEAKNEVERLKTQMHDLEAQTKLDREVICDREDDSSSSWMWNGSERVKASMTSSPTKDGTPPSSVGKDAFEGSVTSG